MSCATILLLVKKRCDCFAEVFPVFAVNLAGREMVSVEKHFRLGDERAAIRLWTG
jgi:hypothetical protein